MNKLFGLHFGFMLGFCLHLHGLAAINDTQVLIHQSGISLHPDNFAVGALVGCIGAGIGAVVDGIRNK